MAFVVDTQLTLRPGRTVITPCFISSFGSGEPGVCVNYSRTIHVYCPFTVTANELD